jgi:fatty-acyl-CoA synthase
MNKVGMKCLVMPESFKKSDYVGIVRELLPDLGKNGSTTIANSDYPNLKHVILCSDKKEPGMINFSELYNIH